jgi:hypothetical protein
MQSPLISIELGRTGIERVSTTIDGISEGVRAGNAVAALSLPLNLLDGATREFFSGKSSNPDEPMVIVPRIVDGEFDAHRRITVRTTDVPRVPFDGVPAWFVDGCKKLFPNEDWDELLLPQTREHPLALHSKEWIESHKDLSDEQLNEISMAPYCNLQEEWAVSLFESAAHGYLDHWGWIEKPDGRDVLVSEPYGISGADLRNLIETLDKVDWDLNVRGVSGHYPSATMRIEIAPKGV